MKKEPVREKCDCEVETLLAEARAKLEKFGSMLYSGYTPWNKTTGFLFCDKHRVYCQITHEPLGAKP